MDFDSLYEWEYFDIERSVGQLKPVICGLIFNNYYVIMNRPE